MNQPAGLMNQPAFDYNQGDTRSHFGQKLTSGGWAVAAVFIRAALNKTGTILGSLRISLQLSSCAVVFLAASPL